ncbi:hypothetical protein V6N11_056779 [Hibiscus sabdariffa]|uniref:Uncharacterized protein n=1 Tax=Hibiscus sabdariffa TaxID=183260 RepID=A0ABR2T545_9ROSI
MVSTAQIQIRFAIHMHEVRTNSLPSSYSLSCLVVSFAGGWLWSMIRTSLWRLQEDDEVATRMCFSSFCADFKSHSQLSEKAEVEAKSIAANRFNRAFEVVDLRLLEEIKSRVLNGIVHALKDYIRGMGGVGKIHV